MRVRVSYTVDVSQEFRRAIRRYYGEEGLASRADIRRWHERFGGSMNDDLMHDYNDDVAP